MFGPANYWVHVYWVQLWLSQGLLCLEDDWLCFEDVGFGLKMLLNAVKRRIILGKIQLWVKEELLCLGTLVK